MIAKSDFTLMLAAGRLQRLFGKNDEIHLPCVLLSVSECRMCPNHLECPLEFEETGLKVLSHVPLCIPDILKRASCASKATPKQKSKPLKMLGRGLQAQISITVTTAALV